MMNAFMVRVGCAGFALGVAAAAPSFADDHPDKTARPAPAHPSMTMSNHSMAMHRTTTVHRNVDVNRTVNVHRNVTVNRSEHIHVVGAGARWRPGLRYTGPRTVFTGWGGYGLAAPAPGYGYYRGDDGSVLLVLLATGVITEAYAVDAGY